MNEIERAIQSLREAHWPDQIGDAMQSLVDLNDTCVDVVPALIAVSQDASEEEGARFQSVNTLGEIGDGRAVLPLIRLLGDCSTCLRSIAVAALAQLGDARAIPELERLARTDKGYIQASLYTRFYVRKDAAKAVALLKGGKGAERHLNHNFASRQGCVSE
jgi:HEAT repeat protein